MVWHLSFIPSNLPQTIRVTCCWTIRAKELGENIKEKSRKFVRKWGRENVFLLGRTPSLYKKNFHLSYNRELERVRGIPPCSPVVFHPFLRVFHVHSLFFFMFLTMLSFSLDFMMLKLSFLSLSSLSTFIQVHKSNLHVHFCWLYWRESLVILPFSCIPSILLHSYF